MLKFILYFFLFTTLNAIASFEESLEKTTLLVQNYYSICFDTNGKFQEKKIVSFESHRINCLEDMDLVLNKVSIIEKDVIKLEEKCDTDELIDFSDMNEISSAIDGKKTCPSKVEDESSCGKELLCNAMSSFLAFPVSGLNTLLEKADYLYKKTGKSIRESAVVDDINKCAGNKNSCVTNLFRGVWDSLFTSVKGMWNLISMATKAGVNAAKKGYDYVVDSVGSRFGAVEDATSEKMLAAQNMSDSALTRFRNDPLLFIKDLTSSMYDQIANGIKSHYGCEEWIGAPHLSKCKSPMVNWECGTCEQRLNVVCGVSGFAAGEIVTAFITGGTVALGKNIVMGSVKAGGVGVDKIKPLLSVFPKASYEKATKVGITTKVKSGVKETYAKALVGIDKFNNLQSVQRIKEASAQMKSKVGSASKRVGDSTVIQVASKSTSTIFSPVNSYLGLMKEAFGKGYGQVDNQLLLMTNKMNLGTATAQSSRPIKPVAPRLDGDEVSLRLDVGMHDPKLLEEIRVLSNDQLTDPVKMHYVLDKMEEMKIAQKKDFESLKLRISEDLKNWGNRSRIAQIAEIRYDNLMSKIRMKSEKIRQEKPHLPREEIQKRAQLDVYSNHSRALQLKNKCLSKDSSAESAKASALYSNSNLTLSVGTVGISYAQANWEKEKDSEWAKRLGYEVFMAYTISKWSSKIATNQATSFTGKVIAGYGLNLKVNLIESTTYSMFFSNDKELAKKRLEEISKSSHFEKDIQELEDYLENRSGIEQVVDSSTDAFRKFTEIIYGRPISEITERELKELKQDSLKDPIVMDRLMDLVADQMYSEEMKGDTLGSKMLDRLSFDTQWGVHSVPRGAIMGAITYQAVCRNIDNPLKALLAFGVLQGTNKAASSMIYYNLKSSEIGQ